MKKTLVILFVAGVLAACKSTDSNKSDYQYKDVPFTNVHFSDNFWASRGSFMSTAIDQLFAGTSNKDYYDNFGEASESARRSYFGRVAYDFAGK